MVEKGRQSTRTVHIKKYHSSTRWKNAACIWNFVLIYFRFIVDRKIFVVGFGLYGSIHGPSEYQVSIQIIQTGSGRVLVRLITFLYFNLVLILFKELLARI